MLRSIYPLNRRKPRLLNERANRWSVKSARHCSCVRSPGCYRNSERSETRTGWSSLRNKLFISYLSKRNNIYDSCCQISLVISNMKFNRKLSEQFWRIRCFPIQSDRRCPRGVSKMAAEWLVLKRLWRRSPCSVIGCLMHALQSQSHTLELTERYIDLCEPAEPDLTQAGLVWLLWNSCNNPI